jgi:hypothetical protein
MPDGDAAPFRVRSGIRDDHVDLEPDGASKRPAAERA